MGKPSPGSHNQHSSSSGVPLEEPPARASERAGPDWSRLFSGGSPRSILVRLVQDDPLGVRQLVAHILRQEAVLLDADRVHLRALALVARHARAYDGRPPLEVWLRTQVERAMGELIKEGAYGLAAAQGLPARARAAELGVYADLARPLGLDLRSAFRACQAMNQRSAPEREAFFALVLDGEDLDRVAHRVGASASEVGRRARRVLDAVLKVVDGPAGRTPPVDRSQAGQPVSAPDCVSAPDGVSAPDCVSAPDGVSAPDCGGEQE